MKKSIVLFVSLMMFLSTGVVTTSCCDNEEADGASIQLPAARITETIRKDDKKATVYNFEYPSQDPFGKPVTLSGSIIVGDEVKNNDNKAAGTVLYNHFTVFQKFRSVEALLDLLMQNMHLTRYMLKISV